MPAAVSTPPPTSRTFDSVAIDCAESNLDSALAGQSVSRHMLLASFSLPLAIKPTTTPPASAATPTPAVTKPIVRMGLPADAAGSGGAAGLPAAGRAATGAAATGAGC